jgi:hypothetical protein
LTAFTNHSQGPSQPAVGRFEIAVNDADSMRGAERFENLPCGVDSPVLARGTSEPVAQGLAVHQLCHHIGAAGGKHSDVVQGADMRMIQRRDYPGLAFKPVAELFGGDLDGDGAAQASVHRPVYPAHPALPEQARDAVCALVSRRAPEPAESAFSLDSQAARAVLTQPTERWNRLCQQGGYVIAQVSIVSTRGGEVRGPIGRLPFKGRVGKAPQSAANVQDPSRVIRAVSP